MYAPKNSSSACAGNRTLIFCAEVGDIRLSEQGAYPAQMFDKCHDEIMSMILPRLKQDLGGFEQMVTYCWS